MEEKDENCNRSKCAQKVESKVACLENLVKLLSVLNESSKLSNRKESGQSSKNHCTSKKQRLTDPNVHKPNCHCKNVQRSNNHNLEQAKTEKHCSRPPECPNATKNLTVIKSEDSTNNNSLKLCNEKNCNEISQMKICKTCFNPMLHLDNVDKRIASLVKVISSYNELRRLEQARSCPTSVTEPFTTDNCTQKLCDQDFCQNEKCKYSVVNKLMKSVYLLTKPLCPYAKKPTCDAEIGNKTDSKDIICAKLKTCVDLNCKDKDCCGPVKTDGNEAYFCKRARDKEDQSKEGVKCSKLTCPLKNCKNTTCFFYPAKNKCVVTKTTKPLNIGWSSAFTKDTEIKPAEVLEPCTDYDCKNTGCQNTIPTFKLFKSKCSIRSCAEKKCHDSKCPSTPFHGQWCQDTKCSLVTQHPEAATKQSVNSFLYCLPDKSYNPKCSSRSYQEAPTSQNAAQNVSPCLDHNCKNTYCQNSIKTLNIFKSKCSNVLCSEKNCNDPACPTTPYRESSWVLKMCSKGNYFGKRSRYFPKEPSLKKDRKNSKDKNITYQQSSSLPFTTTSSKCESEKVKDADTECETLNGIPAIAKCVTSTNQESQFNNINCKSKPDTPEYITPGQFLLKHLFSQSRMCGKTLIAVTNDEPCKTNVCDMTGTKSIADLLSGLDIPTKNIPNNQLQNYRKLITVKVTRRKNPDGTFTEKKKVTEQYLQPKKQRNEFEDVNATKDNTTTVKNDTKSDDKSEVSTPTQLEKSLVSSAEQMICDKFFEPPSHECKKSSSTLVHKQRIIKAKAQAKTSKRFDWATQTDEITPAKNVCYESKSHCYSKMNASTSCITEQSKVFSSIGTCYEDCSNFYKSIPRPKPIFFDKDTCFDHCQKMASKVVEDEPIVSLSCESPTSVLNKILKRDVSHLIDSVNAKLAKPELPNEPSKPLLFLKNLCLDLTCALQKESPEDKIQNESCVTQVETKPNTEGEKIISDLYVQTFLSSIMTKLLENQRQILQESKTAESKCAQCHNSNYYFTDVIRVPYDNITNSKVSKEVSKVSNKTIICQNNEQETTVCQEKDQNEVDGVARVCGNCSDTIYNDEGIAIKVCSTKCSKAENIKEKETCSVIIKAGSSELFKEKLKNVVIEVMSENNVSVIDRSVTAYPEIQDICKECLLKLSGMNTSKIKAKKSKKCSYCDDLESKESCRSRDKQTRDESNWEDRLDSHLEKQNRRSYGCMTSKKESKIIGPTETVPNVNEETSTLKEDKYTNCRIKMRKRKCKYEIPNKKSEKHAKIGKIWTEQELKKYYERKKMVHSSNSTKVSDRYDVRSLYHMPYNTDCSGNCCRQSDPCISSITQCWFSQAYVSKSDVTVRHIACL